MRTSHDWPPLDRGEPVVVVIRELFGRNFPGWILKKFVRKNPGPLIVVLIHRSSRMDVFHAAQNPEVAITPTTDNAEPEKGPSRTCPICGSILKGKKTSACSAACRTAISRTKKKDELLSRIRAAREALRLAEAAVAALEEVAANATVISWM